MGRGKGISTTKKRTFLKVFLVAVLLATKPREGGPGGGLKALVEKKKLRLPQANHA